MKTWALLIFLSAYQIAGCQPPATTPGNANRQTNIPISGDTVYTYRAGSPDGIGKFYMGREIAGVVGPGSASWLDRTDREEEEHSDKAVKAMQLAANEVVADIGAGTGYYSMKVARQVPRGKVYAVELQQELRDHLHRKIEENSVRNIEIVPGDTLQTNLPDNTVDFAFMVDVYHELAWPREMLLSIHNSLKPNGRLMLMEYRGEDPAVRIRPLHKMTVEQITREMKANGFVLDRRVDSLPIQHFLVFRKAGAPADR